MKMINRIYLVTGIFTYMSHSLNNLQSSFCYDSCDSITNRQGLVQLQKFDSTPTTESSSSTPTPNQTPNPQRKFNSTLTQNTSTPTLKLESIISTMVLKFEMKISTQYILLRFEKYESQYLN